MMDNTINVSGTMKSVTEQRVKPHYMVLKIAGRVYSTKYGDTQGVNFKKALLQKSMTEHIGTESNLYLTGVFIEENGHRQIAPIPFELNFYSDLKNTSIEDFKPEDWEKTLCEECGEHLFCPKCNQYIWNKKVKG